MSTLDFGIIGLYLLFFLGIGFFKENKSSRDYFLGGEVWLGTFELSTMATQLSAISFISAPAFVGLKSGGGLQWLTYGGVPLAMAFLMIAVIPPPQIRCCKCLCLFRKIDFMHPHAC